jgi:hypothetical protein
MACIMCVTDGMKAFQTSISTPSSCKKATERRYSASAIHLPIPKTFPALFFLPFFPLPLLVGPRRCRRVFFGCQSLNPRRDRDKDNAKKDHPGHSCEEKE